MFELNLVPDLFALIVNAVLGDWGSWDTCTATCGGGNQNRTRTCTAAQHGGTPCPLELEQQQNCNLQPCAGKSSYNGFRILSHKPCFQLMLLLASGQPGVRVVRPVASETRTEQGTVCLTSSMVAFPAATILSLISLLATVEVVLVKSINQLFYLA